MNSRIVVGWISLFVAAVSVAQPCEERAAQMRGGWIRGNDAGGAGSPATARHKAQVDAVLERIAALVQQAYPEPIGSQGKIYRNYGIEPFAGGGDAAYELTVNFKGYGCDRRTDPAGAIDLYGETATWLRVQVNSFWPGNSNLETPQFFLSPENPESLVTIAPRQILQTPQPGYPDRRKITDLLPERFSAYPSFTIEGSYDSTDYSYNRRVVAQVVFLTADGRLPYAPLSIAEFLDINAERLARYIEENRQYYEMDHQEALLARIPALRQRYAARAAEPVYIRQPSWSEDTLAADQPFADAASGYLVARRSAPSSGGNAGWQPRLITLFWTWQPEAEYSVRAHRALAAGLDLDALRALLTP